MLYDHLVFKVQKLHHVIVQVIEINIVIVNNKDMSTEKYCVVELTTVRVNC